MQPYYNTDTIDDYQIYQPTSTGGAKPKKVKAGKKDSEDSDEKLAGTQQINQVLNDKKNIYLSKIDRSTIKNVRFRTPMILVAKSATNPKKFSTYNVYFIRYDKETEGIWYSFIDPWSVGALSGMFAGLAKTNKAMWQAYYKCTEKFTPLGLINFDETYILKI